MISLVSDNGECPVLYVITDRACYGPFSGLFGRVLAIAKARQIGDS